MSGQITLPDTATDTIRFVLDGEVIELRDVEHTRTVLQFLRDDLRRTGTKEGCAEGDCGACTVVLAELTRSGDDINLRAINSCIQFLPTLHGKELITVESLSPAGKSLHPVQRAMVEQHGSQCGFCTPGFVMSLFALYKTNDQPTRREIDDALAGNLCRCTGYRPIIAAANAMYEVGATESDWLRQPIAKQGKAAERAARLQALASSDGCSFVNGDRTFFSPATIAEFAKLLQAHPDATILAGGTDVGLWVTKQHRDLPVIIYTGRVAELQRLDVTDTHIEIAAAVTVTDAMSLIVEHYPELDELFRRFASPPIRNAGTLGGNIANGSPIGDSMAALMVAGASLVLQAGDDTREISLHEFYIDYMVNALEPGEFVSTIRVPLPIAGVELRSYKLSKRFDQDISAVCTAYRLELDGDKVASIRVACGGLAAIVKRAAHCEAALLGKPWNQETVREAAAALEQDFTPLDDMRASADYRLRASQNLLQRFYLETSGDLTESVYTYGR
jgi:xanthine dehydrogenase small subunit